MGESLLCDETFACLLGGTIGDAMGAPGEGRTCEEIRAEHGWVTDFSGVGTDDTIITHILCEAIISNDGSVEGLT